MPEDSEVWTGGFGCPGKVDSAYYYGGFESVGAKRLLVAVRTRSEVVVLVGACVAGQFGRNGCFETWLVQKQIILDVWCTIERCLIGCSVLDFSFLSW